MRPLRHLYEDLPVSDFGPLKLTGQCGAALLSMEIECRFGPEQLATPNNRLGVLLGVAPPDLATDWEFPVPGKARPEPKSCRRHFSGRIPELTLPPANRGVNGGIDHAA